MNVSIIDLGERKTAFDREARRVRTVIVRQPQAGACEPSRLVIETDGWYIDPPKAVSTPPANTPAPGAGCQDEIKTTETGDARLMGFPISYKHDLHRTGQQGVEADDDQHGSHGVRSAEARCRALRGSGRHDGSRQCAAARKGDQRRE